MWPDAAGHFMAAFAADLRPELALLAGAVILLVFVLFASSQWQKAAPALALATLIVAASMCALVAAGGERTILTGTYALDAIATGGKLIIIAVTAIVVLLSVEWFQTDRRQGEYYVLLLMSALGAVLLTAAADVMELALGVLLSSSTGYVLVAYHRRSRRASEAAMKYYLLGALTNGAMMYGLVLLFGLAGTTTFDGLHKALACADALPLVVAIALVIVGLAFKLGAVPAHAWLPDVAEGAPAPIAAFVAAAPKVGALIGLARLLTLVPDSTSGWRFLIAMIAAATMTLGNVAALWQTDVRRLLGWSAVSQSGYALMAVVAVGRSDLALSSLIYFVLAYTLGNLAAFGVVVALRGRTKLEEYGGLAKTRPLLALALALSLLSFIGIPPLAGFAGKLALFGAAIAAGYSWLAVLAAANTVLSVAYYVRVLAPAYFGPRQEAVPALDTWAATAITLSALALVVVGIVAQPVFDAISRAHLLL